MYHFANFKTFVYISSFFAEGMETFDILSQNVPEIPLPQLNVLSSLKWPQFF